MRIGHDEAMIFDNFRTLHEINLSYELNETTNYVCHKNEKLAVI
jgi:hypothetical protein